MSQGLLGHAKLSCKVLPASVLQQFGPEPGNNSDEFYHPAAQGPIAHEAPGCQVAEELSSFLAGRWACFVNESKGFVNRVKIERGHPDSLVVFGIVKVKGHM